MPSADFCAEIEGPCGLPSRSSYASVGLDTTQTSRGKFDRLLRTTAEFTAAALDGSGLRGFVPARPAATASCPVPVRRLTHLIHASFRPRLTTTPLRFTFLHLHQAGEGTSTPQTVKHTRHTRKKPRHKASASFVHTRVRFRSTACVKWRGQDSNLRPRGYEPRELPDCSTPRHCLIFHTSERHSRGK